MSTRAHGFDALPRDLDVLCFSRLRWSEGPSRPHQLMLRCARKRRVFFIEEPVFGDEGASLQLREPVAGLTVVTPCVPRTLWRDEASVVVEQLLERLAAERSVERPVHWFCAPLALPWTRAMPARLVVYDAPAEPEAHEMDLLAAADVVFTGGHAALEAKRVWHRNVHAFVNSVDVGLFASARLPQRDHVDQARLSHPRIGIPGVVDPRVDLGLVEGVARARPDWQLVMLGPVRTDLGPRPANLHLLGDRPRRDLPLYVAGWDAVLLPHALGAGRSFLAPTAVPELLVTGRPLVVSPVREALPWIELGVVRSAPDPARAVAALERSLAEPSSGSLHRKVARAIAQTSWDRIWAGMSSVLLAALVPARPARSARRRRGGGSRRRPAQPGSQ